MTGPDDQRAPRADPLEPDASPDVPLVLHDPTDAASLAAQRGRAQRVDSFVYGTIATIIAMAAFDTSGSGDPVAAGAIVIVSAVATWFAHAFSTILGERLAVGESIGLPRVWRGLREAWPIVIAAIPATILAVGATQDLWSLAAAVRVSNIAGVIALGGAGFAAARVMRASALSTTAWVLGTSAIGLTIVLVEIAVHQ
jgi:hypothetical protein